jgi:Family of unknown function (DUF6502)
MATQDPSPDVSALSEEQRALLAALAQVMQPLARLCVAKGLTIQAVEEQLRAAFVQAACDAYAHQPAARLTSRISATTGLTRREVARLQAPREAATAPRRSPVTEVFTRWLSDPALRGDDQQPLWLPRQGTAPSFESLAQSVTRDVHPRTLLEELCRLRLAEVDTTTDLVRLTGDAFVPRGDWARMTAFLGDNVGDHLRAATANVLSDGKQHIEQAIFADELSAESLAAARDLMSQQWRTLLERVAPRLEQLIESDRQLGRVQDQSIRIGLFTWSQPMPAKTIPTPPSAQENTP